jgi:hypothetical protein
MMKTVKKGTSIVEVVVAAALIAMGVIAALSLMNYSQKQASYAKMYNEATKYNTQAVDWFRAVRAVMGYDALLGVLQNSGSPVSYCLTSLPASTTSGFSSLSTGHCGPTAYITSSTGQFIRELSASYNSPDTGVISFTITTTWTDKTTHTLTATGEVTKWK